MTPEQQELLEARLGFLPGTSEGSSTSDWFESLLGGGRDLAETARGAASRAKASYLKRPGLYGGLAIAGLTGLSNVGEQDYFGAAGSVGGALGGAKLASSVAGKLLPPQLKAAGAVVAPVLGGLIGSGVGEQITGAIPAAAGAVKEYLGIPTPEETGGRSKEERARRFEREQGRLDYEAMSKAQLARDKEYLSYMLPQIVEQEKALMPLREQMLRTRRVEQQALNASNAALYQQMGRSATLGKFALGQQAEAGATTRTLLSTNPYAGSVLQAPQISFG